MFKIIGHRQEDNDLVGGSNGQYVTLYEHANYQGRSKQLPVGRYGVLPFKNDSISSVQVPEGLRVTLYEHGNFGGRPRTYSSSIANLGDFNDATSSIIVEPSKWYDKLRPDQRIDFEKYIPPEITEKIRGKVQEKMKEETPGIVRWTGIHKSEMAKDKAREKIRDMLPNFLEDKGIEDYLVGRKPIGTGLVGGRRRSKVNWPFIDVVKKIIPPLGHVIESAASLGHERPGQKGKDREISVPEISTTNPFGLALGMTQGGLEMAHLAKRMFGKGSGAYPKCKPPGLLVGYDY